MYLERFLLTEVDKICMEEQEIRLGLLNKNNTKNEALRLISDNDSGSWDQWEIEDFSSGEVTQISVS